MCVFFYVYENVLCGKQESLNRLSSQCLLMKLNYKQNYTLPIQTMNGNYDVTLAMSLRKENTYN